MEAYLVWVARTQMVLLLSCPILRLHYKYLVRAFFSDVCSNSLPLNVHSYFDLYLALSHKLFFISFTSTAAVNVILPVVDKSKILKNSGFSSFIHAYKMKAQFCLWEKTLVSHLYLEAMPQYIRNTHELLGKTSKKTSTSAVSQS